MDVRCSSGPSTHAGPAPPASSSSFPAGRTADSDSSRRRHDVRGGATRADSVRCGLAAVPAAADVIVVHDAARPLASRALFDAVVAALDGGDVDGAVPGVRPSDTIKAVDATGRVTSTLDRAGLVAVQTPQAFRAAALRRAHEFAAAGAGATDDAMLVEAVGGRVLVVPGEPGNLKITAPDDLDTAERLLARAEGLSMRIGQGIDIHRFSEDPHRPLVLGGVVIEGARGLGGHSDADAVSHALADAILGAVGLGDLGRHFPDTDPVWEGADSLALLTEVVRMAAGGGLRAASTATARSWPTRPASPRTRPPWPNGSVPWWRTDLGQGDPGRGHRRARAGRGHRLPRGRLDGAVVSRRPRHARAPRGGPDARDRRQSAAGRRDQARDRGRSGSPGARARGPERARRRPGGGPSGRARVAGGRAPPVRRVLLAEDQDPSPQLDRIEELAARLRVPIETVPRARLDAQARTEAPQGVLALARPLEPVPLEDLCRPDRAARRPSSSSRPASPTRATSAPSCAAPSVPGSRVSCCRATVRPVCRRRWPRRRPVPSNTCPSPSWGACPRR